MKRLLLTVLVLTFAAHAVSADPAPLTVTYPSKATYKDLRNWLDEVNFQNGLNVVQSVDRTNDQGTAALVNLSRSKGGFIIDNYFYAFVLKFAVVDGNATATVSLTSGSQKGLVGAKKISEELQAFLDALKVATQSKEAQ